MHGRSGHNRGMSIDPAAVAGLERRVIGCSMCGSPWEDHLVEPGAPTEDRISLCPSCLLVTSHGDAITLP